MLGVFWLLVSAAADHAWRVSPLPFTLENGEGAIKHLPATVPGGLAVFDFDNDGLLDIFLTNGGDLPSGAKSRPSQANRLLRNLGGLRFADVTARAGLAGSQYSFGAAAADYDNDGDADILVAGLRGVTLYANRGGGVFSDVTTKAGLDTGGRWAVTAAWFDKDNDGDLDLFVTHYVNWNPATEQQCLVNGKPDFCHPRHYAPQANVLFENRGDGTFADVSQPSGIGAHKGRGMSVAAADFDGNGFTDLFVTNDRVFNFLFLNRDGKRFEEAALEWNVAAPGDGNPASGMGADAQDIDGDGHPDLIFTALRDETFPLYRNTGKQGFDEITASSRLAVLTRPMAGWGVALADLDNDGGKDIAVARSDALSATGGRAAAAKEPPAWFRNDRGTFVLGDGWAALPPAMYRGLVAADLDNDGCLDIVLTALNASARVIGNPCPPGRNWLKVDVRRLGARVRVGSQWRTAGSAAGYASSYSGPLHFGLGATKETDVEVFWPGGATKLLPKVAANQTLKVEP